MTGADWIAFLAAAACSVAQGIRANMLKPSFGSWFTAPMLVWLPLALCSAVMAGAALYIVRGTHVPGLVAIVFVAQAIVAWAMLINLTRQSLAPPAEPSPQS